jgi:hypothetical protein
MALRDFTDVNGSQWRVWDVSPHLPLGMNADGPDDQSDGDGADDLHLHRRLVPGLEGGWLCFEAEEEKRRLNPIPESWHELEDPDLQRLLEQAAPVSRRLD